MLSVLLFIYINKEGFLLNNKRTEVTARLEEGKQLKVVDATKEVKPFFHLIGTGVKRRGTQVDAIDFIQVLTEMTKPELFVIRTIKEKIGNNDNIGEVHIPTSMFDSAELQKWKKGIASLKTKKLVYRTKSSHFMINPDALIPNKYEEALKIWNKIVHKDVTPEVEKVVENKTDGLPYDYQDASEESYEEAEVLPYDYPINN